MDVIELKRIAEEYMNEIGALEGDKYYIALMEAAALDKVGRAYCKVRDEELYHENDAWSDRMKYQLQLDIERIRRAHANAQAVIDAEDGRGQCVINVETRRAKLKALERILKDEWKVIPVREDDQVKFQGPDVVICLSIKKLEGASATA